MRLGDHRAQYMGTIALLKWADPFSMGFCFLWPTHFRWPISESRPRHYQRCIRDNSAKSTGPLWMGDCHTLLAHQWWTHLTALTESIKDITVHLVDYSKGEHIIPPFTCSDWWYRVIVTPIDNPGREHLCQPSIILSSGPQIYPWTSAIDIWTVHCLVHWPPTSLRWCWMCP